VWWIWVLVVLAILVIAFVALQTRRRSGGVIAARGGRKRSRR
jgi:preprotein translocase subunit SecG